MSANKQPANESSQKILSRFGNIVKSISDTVDRVSPDRKQEVSSAAINLARSVFRLTSETEFVRSFVLHPMYRYSPTTPRNYKGNWTKVADVVTKNVSMRHYAYPASNAITIMGYAPEIDTVFVYEPSL